jgi:hypothetical protein
MRCPQCGSETPDEAWNCVSCRVNLYWAHQHYNELAKVRQGQGLSKIPSTPSFLLKVHKSVLDDRALRGGQAESKVREIARKVMRGQVATPPEQP